MKVHGGVWNPGRLAWLALPVFLSACGDTPTHPEVGGGRFAAPIEGAPMSDIFYGAYLDQDETGGAQDYACGIKAYDGHRGVDILLRNFQVQDSGVPVLSAAHGQVESVTDGLPDRNTEWGAGGLGNHVVIVHDGGIRSLYGHLRLNSVAVEEGQHVPRGEPLGLVGSSGRSNWPHLHFEVRDEGVAVDPFTGPCGSDRSLWSSQLAYQDGFMVADAGLMEDEEPVMSVLLERPPTVDTLSLDTEQFHFWIQLANQRANPMLFELVAPGGETEHEFHFQADATFSMRYIYLTVQVAGSLTEPGEWQIRTFQNDELIWTQPFTLRPGMVAAGGGEMNAEVSSSPERPRFTVRVLDQVPSEHGRQDR